MAIPLSGRVPGRASGPSRSQVDGDDGSRCILEKVIRSLGFSYRGVFIGEGAAPKVDLGGLTTGGREPGAGRAPWWCGPPVTPLRLLFGSLEAWVNFWMFGFCLVQFREYFMCNFSKTQK
jgi:hypothetical protein